MQVYIVEYTNQDCVGNQCLTMEIEAPNLETAYEIVNQHYPDLCVDQILAQDQCYDFDPDC